MSHMHKINSRLEIEYLCTVTLFQSLLVLLVTVLYFSQRNWKYLIWHVNRPDISDYEISPFLIGFQHVFCFSLPQAGFQFGVSLQFLGWIC